MIHMRYKQPWKSLNRVSHTSAFLGNIEAKADKSAATSVKTLVILEAMTESYLNLITENGGILDPRGSFNDEWVSWDGP